MTSLRLCVIVLNIYIIGLVRSKDIYEFKVSNNKHEEVSLDDYKGQVLLVVNVASHCGYTEGTYRALTRLHDILGYGGYFSVLAFPCNQFGEQEPGSIEEIEGFARDSYGCEFPIFDKIDVIGAEASPLFKYLIEQTSLVPEWNFYKYLVDSEGKVVKGWDTKTTVEDIFDDVSNAIKEAKKLHLARKKAGEEKNSENPKDEL